METRKVSGNENPMNHGSPGAPEDPRTDVTSFCSAQLMGVAPCRSDPTNAYTSIIAVKRSRP
eukprot:7437872-Pyramimonas_sp.AAC.1